MTVEEKRISLKEYCVKKSCSECALHGKKVCRCRNNATFDNRRVDESGYISDAEIIGAYELVFGKCEIETVELKEAAIIPDTIHIGKVKNLHLTINNFNYEEDQLWQQFMKEQTIQKYQ